MTFVQQWEKPEVVRSSRTLLLVTLPGAVLVVWPLFVPAASVSQWQTFASPALTALVIPVMFALAINETVQHQFNTKQLAVIAVLIAVAAAVRPLGAGVAGIEPVWIVLIITGRALGATSGFIAGSGAIATSAVLTGAIGPWMPYQMVLAAWIASVAGFLPRLTTRIETVFLACYAFVATFLFGWLMNLWFWTTATGLSEEIVFNPSASPFERIQAWAHFSLVTSLGFDLPRACFCALGVALASKPMLAAIRRANRRSLTQPIEP